MVPGVNAAPRVRTIIVRFIQLGTSCQSLFSPSFPGASPHRFFYPLSWDIFREKNISHQCHQVAGEQTPNCTWGCWFPFGYQSSFMFCVSVCLSVKWWLLNIYLQVFSKQLLYTQPCARCIGGNFLEILLPVLKREREVRVWLDKASHQRSLSKEFAKTGVLWFWQCYL